MNHGKSVKASYLLYQKVITDGDTSYQKVNNLVYFTENVRDAALSLSCLVYSM